MKKILLAISLVVGVTTTGLAQCDKNFTVLASKTEYLDGSGTVQRSVDEKSTLVFTNNKDISVVHGTEGNEQSISGVFKYDSCSWKVPFKNGKSILKAELMGPSGEAENVTIFIEGKEGKISVLVNLNDGSERQIRLTVDRFEEKK